jgi:hypothetical protein
VICHLEQRISKGSARCCRTTSRQYFSFGKWSEERELWLGLVLLENGNRDATDTRDKIYGVLGLTTFRWGPGSDMKINYSMPVDYVYQMATVFSMADTCTLAMLAICHEERQLQSLPSWVPDWSVKRNPLTVVRASNRNEKMTTAPRVWAMFAWFPPYLRVSGLFLIQLNWWASQCH